MTKTFSRPSPTAMYLWSLLLVSGGLTAWVQAQQEQGLRQPAPVAELRVLPLRGNIYLLHGAGANITLSVGKDGVLLVDSGTPAAAARVVATVQDLVRQVTVSPTPAKPCAGLGCTGASFPNLLATVASLPPPPPIRFIVNTNPDEDHVGGNARVAQAGVTLGGGPGLGQFLTFVKASAMVYSHENVLRRLAAANVPVAGLPTESYQDDFKQYFNGEGVHLIHRKAARTDGDTIVHFRGSDIISAGDTFSTATYPMVDIERGGSIDGVLDTLNYLLELAIPEYQSEGGTLVIPGHGRVSDMADVAAYRDAVTIIRDRIDTMIQRGMTVEQVKAARPTKDYDPRYDSRQWTKDAFVEAVYKSLTRKQEKGL